MSQVFNGQKLQQEHCPFENAKEHPTFLFGKHNDCSAEILDDSHFENLADTISKYSRPTSDDALQQLVEAEKLPISGSVPILFRIDRFQQ